ncbi:hypothetical protein ACIP9H_33285 [Streptomyces sp. NPDC088732]|uniref:hypothetical protein n=1 Tax=Streptomyces sp. NPDC088732 TaxID=3365879 RepID=UPI00381CD77C
MIRPREIGYTDDLLADRSVHRTYEDGRHEWRRRGAGGVVHWHDEHGNQGTDELLGHKIVKRVLPGGTVTYGRDIGFGRTLWGTGDTLTINRTSFGGRTGAILVGLGVTGLAVTASQLPPLHLSLEEEEELRRQAQSSSSSGGGDGGGDGGDWGDGNCGDDGGGWSDDDFG